MAEFHDLDVECVHRERQPDLVAFKDPGTPACHACSLARALQLLKEANRDLKWTKEGEQIAEAARTQLERNQSGWKGRAKRLEIERDEADRNAGRMQRELRAAHRTLAGGAESFLLNRVLGVEPPPGERHREWSETKRAVDRAIGWLKSFARGVEDGTVNPITGKHDGEDD